MRNTIKSLRDLADRFKVLTGLIMLLLAGALISGATVSWNYERTIASRIKSYDRQIVRKDKEIDAERFANRQMLANIAAELAAISAQASINTEELANIASDLDEIAKDVSVASKTARSAATTARSAAKSAAQPKITITEVRPSPQMSRKRIKNNEVEP